MGAPATVITWSYYFGLITPELIVCLKIWNSRSWEANECGQLHNLKGQIMNGWIAHGSDRWRAFKRVVAAFTHKENKYIYTHIHIYSISPQVFCILYPTMALRRTLWTGRFFLSRSRSRDTTLRPKQHINYYPGNAWCQLPSHCLFVHRGVRWRTHTLCSCPQCRCLPGMDSPTGWIVQRGG